MCHATVFIEELKKLRFIKKTCLSLFVILVPFQPYISETDQFISLMSLNPSSDWDDWTPPNMSNVATVGSDADLLSVIAEAGSQQPPRRRRTLSTIAVVRGPTSRRI